MVTFTYPILWHFGVGILGAFTFLFLMLLFDKDVAVLDNEFISKKLMACLYLLLGGVLAVIMTIPTGTDLSANQLRVAYATGLGWPAVATGIGAGKRMGDLGLAIGRKKEMNLDLQDKIGRVKDETSDYFKKRLDRAEELLQIALERAEREKQEIRSFYAKKIEDLGGN